MRHGVIAMALVFSCACGDARIPAPSASGATSGGGEAPLNADDCSTCETGVFTTGGACEPQLSTCLADPNCFTWYQCIERCFHDTYTRDCFAACDQQFAHLSSMFEPVYGCLCDRCDVSCSAACP